MSLFLLFRNSPSGGTPAGVVLVTAQPSHTATGVAFSPDVVARAYLADGTTPDTSYTGSCVATLTGNGTLSGGTTVVNCVLGVATFSNLIPNGDGSEYTVTFAMTGYSSAVSTPFTIIGAHVAANQALVTLFGGNTKLFHINDARVFADAYQPATLGDVIGTVAGRAAGVIFRQSTGANQLVVTGGQFILNGSRWMIADPDNRLDADDATPVHAIMLAEASAVGPLVGFANDPTDTGLYPQIALEAGASTFIARIAPTGAATILPDSEMAWGSGILRLGVNGKATRIGNGNIDEMWRFLHSGVQDMNHKILVVATTVPAGLQAFIGKLGSAIGTGKIPWLAFSTADITGDIWTGLQTFMRTEFPTATLDSSKWGTHVEVGSSIGRGSNGTDPMSAPVGSGTTSYPHVAAVATTGPRAATWAALGMCTSEIHRHNRCRSGNNPEAINASWDTDLAILFDGMRRGPNTMELDGGAFANGVQGFGWDYATAMGHIDTLWGLCKSVGCKLIIVPCWDRGGGNNNSNGNLTGWYLDGTYAALSAAGVTIQAVHAELLANPWAHCDGVITSVLTHASFEIMRAGSRACLETTLYQVDHVHGKDLSYSQMGGLKRAFYDARDGYLFPLAHYAHSATHRGGLMALAGGM